MTADEEQLIKNVLNLNKKVTFKKPRTEPSIQISEFNLAKPRAKKDNSVRVADLTDVLKRKVKHEGVRQKIQTFERKIKPLPKPLEKPKADRIRRSAAFSKIKKNLNRWNAVVTSNRASNHLTFPLVNDTTLELEINSSPFRLKTDLEKRLEALRPPAEIFNLEQESRYPLTMQEMLERRKEMAKMKIIESNKAAKARRQNKIKSKKFHRIQRREKIKNQIKDFEQLQKTNPEEALKKLDEIERVRAEERASLRHRNTGKWAKSKQVKAKYDNTNRQELAQQLGLSRELTQKINVNEDESESDDENANQLQSINVDNPWINPIKTSEEIESFHNGYRKFWDNTNTAKELKAKEVEKEAAVAQQMQRASLRESAHKPVNISYGADAVSRNSDLVCMATTPWDVSVLSDTDDDCEDIDEMFDKYNDQFQTNLNKITQRLNKNKNQKKKKTKVTAKTDKKRKYNSEDLSFVKEAKRPMIDEPLDENHGESTTIKELNLLLKPDAPALAKPKDIDPNDIICTKAVDLETELPDLLTLDDEANDDQKGAIAEAFEDDDIVDSFQNEKRDVIEGAKPKDIDLFLPGWGSWGGPGIVPSQKKKRSNKRFIIKFPKECKRRDENKGNLIINEKPNEKVKQHLVSEVPFPFTTVKDFEASIRAPIGNTFIPQTAFRRMIKPAVTTKMGAVIEPMNEAILLKKKK